MVILMEMTITQFKAKCLSVVEKVQREKVRVVISRHGRPAAQVLPVEERLEVVSLFGSAAETTEICGELMETGEGWDAEH